MLARAVRRVPLDEWCTKLKNGPFFGIVRLTALVRVLHHLHVGSPDILPLPPLF